MATLPLSGRRSIVCRCDKRKEFEESNVYLYSPLEGPKARYDFGRIGNRSLRSSLALRSTIHSDANSSENCLSSRTSASGLSLSNDAAGMLDNVWTNSMITFAQVSSMKVLLEYISYSSIAHEIITSRSLVSRM